MIEFALSTAFWVPLLMGVHVIGLNMVRAIQVTQIARDTGNMFAKGVDFSEAGNQDIVFRLASGLDFERDGGEGVMILSAITYIGANECIAGGRQPNAGSCPNLDRPVVFRRIVFGNPERRSSSFATPRNGIIGANGYIPASAYLMESSVRAAGFSELLPMTPGQIAYVAEMYQASPDLDWADFMTGTGIYARSIF
jgi:hypothetical protein